MRHTACYNIYAQLAGVVSLETDKQAMTFFVECTKVDRRRMYATCSLRYTAARFRNAKTLTCIFHDSIDRLKISQLQQSGLHSRRLSTMIEVDVPMRNQVRTMQSHYLTTINDMLREVYNDVLPKRTKKGGRYRWLDQKAAMSTSNNIILMRFRVDCGLYTLRVKQFSTISKAMPIESVLIPSK